MIKRFLLILSTIILFSSVPVSANTLDGSDSPADHISCAAASETVMPLADSIGWRYKTINGKLYKRLYNYTKKKWVGDWIPC